jgi:uncharacterized membrane protein (UPF0127 family)
MMRRKELGSYCHYEDRVERRSYRVHLLAKEESVPQEYSDPYVVVPYNDCKAVRVTRKGDQIVSEEEYTQIRGKTFIVNPPPPGHTYSLRNVGDVPLTFQKQSLDPLWAASLIPMKPKPAEDLAITGPNIAAAQFFRVEVLTSEDDLRMGYRLRADVPEQGLGPNEGMLFLWGGMQSSVLETIAVLVHLDIAFIDADGTIQKILFSVPEGTRDITHTAPSRAVLETKAGNLSSRNIAVGDIVHHPAFNNVISKP